ncbi:MAG: hypothetical protein NT007_19300 [Candidatus Kapabacteria bacterium]|nr:hypothetical protein [Candidatus Kapabacteria bacterium]
MNNKSTFFINIFIIFSLVLCSACKTNCPYCIGEKHKALEIRWGKLIKTSSLEYGYVLDSYGNVSDFTSDSNLNIINKQKIAVFKDSSYCRLLVQAYKVIMQTQVLNEPGDTCSFFELKDPSTDYFKRGIWNKYNTVNSLGFRTLCDSLNAAVEISVAH